MISSILETMLGDEANLLMIADIMEKLDCLCSLKVLLQAATSDKKQN